MAHPVFVSYSKTDLDAALDMVAYLENAGIDCWIAPRDITPSAEWAAEIIDAISSARVMVLIFSAQSNESPQVRREVERAVHKRVPVIAFRIDEALPEKSLEYFLSAQHWLDAFSGSRVAHYDRLLRCLKSTLDPSAAPYSTGTHPQLDPSLMNGTNLFAPEDIRRIEGHLARYVGPIAKVLVMRAALHSTSVEDLKLQLSRELDAGDERREFMAL